MIFTISGLDGSGKSTQIELLKKYLESKGKTFFYFHAVEFSIANRSKVPPKARLAMGGKSQKSKSITKANWLQIQLRRIALLVDICRFKRLLKKLSADYIISDRYFYDTVVNINFLSGKEKKICAEKFIPKPDIAFYLKINPEEIMKRERKPDQGLEYLVAKEKLYECKIKAWDMLVLDGGRIKEEIFEEIKSRINV